MQNGGGWRCSSRRQSSGHGEDATRAVRRVESLASLGFVLSVAPSAYGIGKIATGHHSGRDIAILVFGLGVGTLIVLSVRHREAEATAEGVSGG